MVPTERKLDLLEKLGGFVTSNNEEWIITKFNATQANAWFTAEHIELSIQNIVNQFLNHRLLQKWLSNYTLPQNLKTVGIVMAGNIPLVGFHDFLCGFLSGHHLLLKLSSKDAVLLTFIINKLIEWEPLIANQITISERLNNCDAYIATGSNNTARYFKQYFVKYPHIIRGNRTSVAILNGEETFEELQALSDDVYQYFGLGCRNVTQVCVPEGYDFQQMLHAFRKYHDYKNFSKYINNYDYHFAIYLLNGVPYMSNESLLLVENDIPFAAVSVLHYRYYNPTQEKESKYISKDELIDQLTKSTSIQAIIGKDFLQYGTSQQPQLTDYADGINTMKFLCEL